MYKVTINLPAKLFLFLLFSHLLLPPSLERFKRNQMMMMIFCTFFLYLLLLPLFFFIVVVVVIKSFRLKHKMVVEWTNESTVLRNTYLKIIVQFHFFSSSSSSFFLPTTTTTKTPLALVFSQDYRFFFFFFSSLSLKKCLLLLPCFFFFYRSFRWQPSFQLRFPLNHWTQWSIHSKWCINLQYNKILIRYCEYTRRRRLEF